jgi:hypothetical protein
MIHVLGAQELDGAALGVVVPLGADDDEGVAVGAGVGARAGDDVGVVRVVDLLDEERDALVAPRPGAPGLAGGAVVEQLDGGDDPVARRVLDAARVVDDGGDGGLGDPRLTGDVVDRGSLVRHRGLVSSGGRAADAAARAAPGRPARTGSNLFEPVRRGYATAGHRGCQERRRAQRTRRYDLMTDDS